MHADWKWDGNRGELTLDATRVLRVRDEVPGQWRIDICVGDAFLCDVVAGSREAAVEAVEKAAGVYVDPQQVGIRMVADIAARVQCPHPDWKWTGDRGERRLADGRVLLAFLVGPEASAHWIDMQMPGGQELFSDVYDTRESAVEAVEKAAGVWVEPLRVVGSVRSDTGRLTVYERTTLDSAPENPTDAAARVLSLAMERRMDPPQTGLQAAVGREPGTLGVVTLTDAPAVGGWVEPRALDPRWMVVGHDGPHEVVMLRPPIGGQDARAAELYTPTTTTSDPPQTPLQTAVGREEQAQLEAEADRFFVKITKHVGKPLRASDMDALRSENERLTRELAALRRTVAEECAVACEADALTTVGAHYRSLCAAACRAIGGAK